MKWRVVPKMTSIEIATQIRMETVVLFSKILNKSAILDKNSLGTKMGHGKSKKTINYKQVKWLTRRSLTDFFLQLIYASNEWLDLWVDK